MAGAAAARALTAGAAAVRTGRFELALATAADAADVRQLLRAPLAGDVLVSLEREPDARVAAAIEGDVHQTLVARERASNRIAATASRSVRDAFLNGRPARVGYLGQLRIAHGFGSSRALLDQGFAFCRELHEAGDARLYLTSIVAGNDAARRLLLGTRARSAPRFAPAGALSALVLPRRRTPTRSTPPGVEIHRGSPAVLADIAACLWRNGERHQFAPCWTVEDLCSSQRTPNLSPEDFFVATSRGRVVACLASWDQRDFKQAVVRGYSRRLARWRPAIDFVAPWLGIPRLPPVGRRLEFAYLSHLAVDGDDGEVAGALVAAACGRLSQGVDYAVLGVAQASPLRVALRRRFRHREYCSELYVAYWPDGEAVVRALDTRVPHPEVATL